MTCVFFIIQIPCKEIVGIVKITKEAFIDPTDKLKKIRCGAGKFEKKLDIPVTLENIKKIRLLRTCL